MRSHMPPSSKLPMPPIKLVLSGLHRQNRQLHHNLNSIAAFRLSSHKSAVSLWPPFLKLNKMSTTSASANVGNGRPPVVVVLGSTATGKSKLAIELASQIPGEIISADSMQVYEGLDILTNKATKEEMKGIPHHMIGIVDRSQKFDVFRFRDRALPLVERILSEGKVPYIVGGTNYYIESLLWEVLIDEDDSYRDRNSNSDSDADLSPKRPKIRLTYDDLDTSNPVLCYLKERGGDFTEKEVLAKWSPRELHDALQLIDEKRAMKFHPNEKRKTVRSLQVFFRTGRKHSDLIEEQCRRVQDEEQQGDNNDFGSETTPGSLRGKLGGPLRFSNCVCLWIQAERSILNGRIDQRADKMVDLGIRQELDDYVDQVMKENRKWDFEEGQLQSIGVKEFQSYIQLPPDQRRTELGDKLFLEGLELLKIATRQYAKQQVKWVTNRFLKSSRRQLPLVYGLDGNQVDEVAWNKNVCGPALEILKAHVEGNLNSPLLKEKLVPVEEGEDDVDLISRRCDVCDRILVGSRQFESHMQSRRHWKMVKRKRDQEARLLKKSEMEAGTLCSEANN